MEAKASVRYVRISARKARMVLNLVRGKSVPRAKEILQFSERDVAQVIGKLIDSACANAAQKDGVRPENLYVKTIFADEGPTLKRIRPRAKGSASRIHKRTCHITTVVATREEA